MEINTCFICGREDVLNDHGKCKYCQIGSEVMKDVTSDYRERIKTLESAMQEFINFQLEEKDPYCAGKNAYETAHKFKQLLEQGLNEIIS